MKLTVIIQQDEDGRYTAYCPELTGCASWGMTPEDALKNVREAIELYLEDIPKSELKKHISRIKVEKITV
jgi:predicted RNase H-like HicB family nuclease